MKFKAFIMSLICGATLFTVDAKDKNNDWAQFGRYHHANDSLLLQENNDRRVVFIGNSITDNWATFHPEFFNENGYVGRGISGQTTFQFIVRFREDVINLKPAVVVINGGINDIAENTQPYNEDLTYGNIISMVQLAQANGIKVIMTTLLPAANIYWNKSIENTPEKIISLNARLKQYAEDNNIPFVDYYSRLVQGEDKALNPKCTTDGLHPTMAGYEIMEPIIKQAIDQLLSVD